jgi:hypothetical protein
MTAESLLARLLGVRRSGSGWLAKCPAHRDRNPSLSISERDGKVLLHCFAGCTAESICATLGIRVSDLFAESAEKRAPVPRVAREAERELSAAGLRSRLTPRERVLPVTLVYADREYPDPAIARALALAVEGELVQISFAGEEAR